MLRKIKVSVFLLALLALGIALAGCTGSDEPVVTGNGSDNTAGNQAAVEPEVTPVQTVELFLAMSESWDADAETDGIDLTLLPKDSKDDIVKQAGTVSAELYRRGDSIMESEAKKGELIQKWENIKIEEDNYDYFGVKVRLEYNSDFTAKEYEMGWLEVTFKTTDGKEFKAKNDHVILLK